MANFSEGQLQRFGSLIRLYGEANFEKLTKAHVAVIGLGGVGSWIFEALVRSGVGQISIFDMDDCCISNANRQLHSLDGNFGKAKVSVLMDRAHAINPEIIIHPIFDFVTLQNVEQMIDVHFDVVIDAIDGVSSKCAIIARCRDKAIPVITIGAAAGKTDPTKISCEDLGKTIYDYLLKRVRKKLRVDYGFPRGKKPLMNVHAIYSTELPVYPDGKGGVCATLREEDNLQMDCQTGMGSSVMLTASFGLLAAKVAVDIIQHG